MVEQYKRSTVDGRRFRKIHLAADHAEQQSYPIMYIRSGAIGILLLQSIALYSQTVAKVEIQSRVYDSPTEDVFDKRPSLWNQNDLAYAFCPNLLRSDPVPQSHCTLALGNSPDDVRFCNVTISDSEGLIRNIWNYYQIGKDKIILQWLSSNDEFYYGIVEFNNCAFTYVNVTHSLLVTGGSVVMPLEDHTYDINYVDEYNGCENWCRMTLDDEGHVLANPKHNLNSSDYIAVTHSPIQGRLVVLSPWDVENVTQVAFENDDGTIKILKEFPIEKKVLEGPDQTKKYSVSTSYQLLTVCSAINLTVYCGQFDNNGTLKFEDSIEISHVHYLNKLKVYNMLNGGFLLLFNSGDGQPVFATKVNAAGQQVGTLQLPQFPCHHSKKDFRLFTNADKEPCFTEMCKYKDHLSFDYACYPDKAFGK